MNNKYTETSSKGWNSFINSSQTPVSSREYILGKIQEYSKNLVINSTVYKEILRSLLSSIKITFVNAQQENIQVKIHHGRQERIVAKKYQENNLILPYSTIFQSSVATDTTKRKASHILTTESYWDDASRRAQRIFSEPDVPVKLEYTLSLWSKYVSDMDQISSKIRSYFNPHIILETPFSKMIPVYIKEETDQSTTEVLDKEDRLIRKNFIFEIETYIQSPKYLITNTGKITHLNTEIWV